MIIEDLGNDGITSLFRHTFATGADGALNAPRELFDPNDFDDFLSRLTQRCDKVLKEKGLTSADGRMLILKDGRKKSIEAGSRFVWNPEIHEKIVPTILYVKQYRPCFSTEWYAAAMAELCIAVAQPSVRGGGNQAMNLLRLGSLLKDQEWREQYKPDIVSAKERRKTIKGNQQPSLRSRKAKAAKRLRLVAKIVAETNLSKGALLKRVHQTLAANPDTKVCLRTVARDLKQLKYKDPEIFGHLR
jgi:hypothetical protein